MSFSFWPCKPPFDESALNEGERIYQVEDHWIVTDDPSKANQQAIDDVVNAPVVQQPTIADVLSVLSPDQQAQIQAIQVEKA